MRALGYLSALAAAGALGAAVILACSNPTPAVSPNTSGNDFDTLEAVGNRNPYGLWSDGTTMWVADALDAKIYAYSMSTKARTP